MTEEKLSLGGVSFIAHYRHDSDDRFFNLTKVLEYYHTFFRDFEFILINDDSVEDLSAKTLCSEYNVNFVFMENCENFKKTKAYNIGTQEAKYDILGYVDVDVMIHPKHMLRAVRALEFSQADHIYPYNGTFVNIKKPYFDKFLNGFQFDNALGKLETRTLFWESDELYLCHTRSRGGMFLMTRKCYNNIGKFSEEFVGWGYEDDDIYNRSMNSGNRLAFLTHDDCIMWHLDHFAVREDSPEIEANKKLFIENAK